MRVFALTALLLLAAWPAAAGPSSLGKIIKVLPHYLDKQGRHTVSPSLYARDAYQAELRKNPALQSALRFDVEWKARTSRPLKLRVEMRGVWNKETTSATVEQEVQFRGLFNKWTSAELKGEAFKKFGELAAWRVTMWDGDVLLSSQKSFMW